MFLQKNYKLCINTLIKVKNICQISCMLTLNLSLFSKELFAHIFFVSVYVNFSKKLFFLLKKNNSVVAKWHSCCSVTDIYLLFLSKIVTNKNKISVIDCETLSNTRYIIK